MKLWKISQEENNNYDTYDSAVVAAEDEETARDIDPGYDWGKPTVDWDKAGSNRFGTWARHREAVNVMYLGEADPGIPAGVVLASFNAS